MNIRLCLSYDGTEYHGWQRQENALTVQELVEQAIEDITGDKVSVCGCSRTDAGVHALQYYCNFYSDTKIPYDKIPIALNTALPKDIRIIGASVADENFHSRFSATSKTYRYYIDNGKIQDVFLGRYSYHLPVPLDISEMKRAAEAFVGTHDFTAFMASGSQQKTTIRTVNRLSVDKNGNTICIEINANAYLYNMVRIISGTLVYAGLHKLRAEEMPRIIESRCRERAGITVPAKGLFLCEVNY